MTGPAATSSALAGDYEMDPAHSRLGFVARHTMFTKVHGQFNESEGNGLVRGVKGPLQLRPKAVAARGRRRAPSKVSDVIPVRGGAG